MGGVPKVPVRAAGVKFGDTIPDCPSGRALPCGVCARQPLPAVEQIRLSPAGGALALLLHEHQPITYGVPEIPNCLTIIPVKDR